MNIVLRKSKRNYLRTYFSFRVVFLTKEKQFQLDTITSWKFKDDEQWLLYYSYKEYNIKSKVNMDLQKYQRWNKVSWRNKHPLLTGYILCELYILIR